MSCGCQTSRIFALVLASLCPPNLRSKALLCEASGVGDPPPFLVISGTGLILD